MTISNILFLLNIMVLAFLFFLDARGLYVEYSMYQLIILVAFQVILIALNKRIENKLLDLLIIHIFIFYILRIPFIFFDTQLSDVLVRNVEVLKINNSILILNIQILIFSGIIIIFKPLNNLFLNIENFKPPANNLAILLFSSLIILLNLIKILYFWFYSDLLKTYYLSIFFAIFNITLIEIFLLALLFININSNCYKLKFYILFQLFLCLIISGSLGSKSAALQVLELSIIFVVLSYGTKYYICFKRFLYIIFYLLFTFLGYLLGHKLNHIREGLISQRLIEPQASIINLDLDTVKIITPPHPLESFSYRIGYLDFYIDKVTQEVYLQAFNFSNYLKAIIDGLTPGFNIWGNIPLASRAVFNAYFGPSSGPNSEVITIFAEANIFFGYLSGFIYLGVLILIYIFNRLSNLIARNDYERLVALFFTGFCFEQYLMGFGLDYWFMANFVYLMVSFFVGLVFIRLFSIKKA